MKFAGLGPAGRLATRMAAWTAPPHKARTYLAYMSTRGYISARTTIYHKQLKLGRHVFVDDGVVVFQRQQGGPLEIGDRVCLYRDTIIETGFGGSLVIGEGASIHPRCQINAYVVPIHIGKGVMIAPSCALYPYDHGILPGQSIISQPLQSRGPINIGDGAWLGFGVIVLGGVTIGAGAVVGAGSIVTSDIPDDGIAVGIPAKVVKSRRDLSVMV